MGGDVTLERDTLSMNLAAANEHLAAAHDLLREVAEWIDLMEHPGPLAQATRKKIAEALGER